MTALSRLRALTVPARVRSSVRAVPMSSTQAARGLLLRQAECWALLESDRFHSSSAGSQLESEQIAIEWLAKLFALQSIEAEQALPVELRPERVSWIGHWRTSRVLPR